MNEMKKGPEEGAEVREGGPILPFEDEGPDSYVVLPILDDPGHWIAVFADGSYVKDWVPVF